MNDFDNLVLIKNKPYHDALNYYQSKSVSKLNVGEEIELEWPIIDNSIYK